MSLLNRKSISIGRGERKLRDDRVFVAATDDTYAPAQYFEHLPLPRVKIVVLPTPGDSGLSAPVHVVERLKAAFQIVRRRKQVQSGDEFWVLLDTDHYFQANNIAGTLAAIQNAQHAGFEIAASNPCFELWLLLHHEDVAAGTAFKDCEEVIQRIKTLLGGYNKTAIRSAQFPLDRVPDAIRRARALESSPDSPTGLWPQQTGTRVYRLLEKALTPATP